MKAEAGRRGAPITRTLTAIRAAYVKVFKTGGEARSAGQAGAKRPAVLRVAPPRLSSSALEPAGMLVVPPHGKFLGGLLGAEALVAVAQLAGFCEPVSDEQGCAVVPYDIEKAGSHKRLLLTVRANHLIGRQGVSSGECEFYFA